MGSGRASAICRKQVPSLLSFSFLFFLSSFEQSSHFLSLALVQHIIARPVTFCSNPSIKHPDRSVGIEALSATYDNLLRCRPFPSYVKCSPTWSSSREPRTPTSSSSRCVRKPRTQPKANNAFVCQEGTGCRHLCRRCICRACAEHLRRPERG